MNKSTTIKNMAEFIYTIYNTAVLDESVSAEMVQELGIRGIENLLGGDLTSWVKTYNYFDGLNAKLVKFAKARPEQYEPCRILNRKLIMLMDGMKNVMEKDMYVTGWIRNNGRIEVVI